MTFDIDLNKYKVVDLSKLVIPNQSEPDDRPFFVQESHLPDGTYKFDIIKTHTHVGTHVESPWHFYHEGKTITDFPIEHFMGKTLLFKAVLDNQHTAVSLDLMKEQIEQYRGKFEILLIRNNSSNQIRFNMETVPYIRDLKIKMLIFEAGIEFGNGIEDGRKFHDILMSNDICLVEFPEQCKELDQDLFYLFAVPVRIQGLDSAMCRLFAVVEK